MGMVLGNELVGSASFFLGGEEMLWGVWLWLLE